MPNRLASETSPYLLQHADNPVDWYPWGPEALERARQEDKPILLSIGYAACHWCHVMAHESFEDAETARLMNAAFVNIKVDREERPDIDGIYMQAVQAMTGHGGWPMTVFLTPDGVPFYGGTYFPPEDRHGIPSFRKILFTISAAYTDQRDRVAETASAMRRLYAESAARRDPGIAVEARTLELAYRSLSRQYDVAHGGFGGAPKFPPTMALEFLLRYWRRTKNDDALNMAHHTFLQMGRGGIFDQIGGGFARYSVDGRWQVPHFEKMLYDNALLIRLGAHLYLATRDAEVRRVTEQTIEWAARELRSPEGAFYSSFDADSEGEEGLFYTWDSDEFDAVSGASAPILREYFGVTAEGNFEGRNILHRPSGDEVAAVRAGIPPAELATLIQSASLRLREARATRVWPGRDDKIIAAWNGLMARALADASLAFDSDEYAAMSLQCCTFLFDKLTETPDGELPRVLRSYGRGGAYIPGFLEDHAALGLAAIAAYGLTFNSIWLRRARNVADSCVRFFRGDDGLFRDTANDAEVLITRPRDTSDNATPAGNSLAAELLLLVADYYDREPEREIATAAVSSLSHAVSSYPSAFGHLLCAADTLVNGTLQLALVGSDLPAALERNGMKAVLAGRYIPALVVAASAPGSDDLPLLRGKTAGTAAVTAFLCRRYLCDAPTSSAGELQTQIESALRSGNAPEESSS